MLSKLKKYYKRIILVLILLAVTVLVLLKTRQMYHNITNKMDVIADAIQRGDSSNYDETVNESEVVTIDKIVEEEIQKQEEIEKLLIAELDSGVYTFKEPLVVVNPYGKSPLSALILFCTEEPVDISIELLNKGMIEADNVYATFKSVTDKTRHIVPIYGLYSNTTNKVKLLAKDAQGKTDSIIVDIVTEELINNLKETVFITSLEKPDDYQKGFNFSYHGAWNEPIKKAFDSSGEIRWYFDDNSYTTVSRYAGAKGHMMHVREVKGREAMYEMDYLGRIYSVYFDTQLTHHDIYLTEKNSMIVTKSSDREGDTCEDILKEIDLDSGEVIQYLDYKKLLPKTRNVGTFYSDYDWMHMNSVVDYDEDLIVSSNCQSSIIRNDWNGNIKWILSSSEGWFPQWNKYLLKPIGDDFEYPCNQHAVEVLPDYDNNPNTVDIILFDNGKSRNKMNNSPEADLYSRMVHYRIDEINMTVEQIWEFGKEFPVLYSPFRSDANLLANDNYLGTFNTEDAESGERSATVYIEVNEDKDIIWECYAADKTATSQYHDYRTDRLDIYEYADYTPLGAHVSVYEIQNSEGN